MPIKGQTAPIDLLELSLARSALRSQTATTWKLSGSQHLGNSSSPPWEPVSIHGEYEQAGTPELHATSLIDTVWSPRLRLEGNKREERGKQQTNKQQQQTEIPL